MKMRNLSKVSKLKSLAQSALLHCEIKFEVVLCASTPHYPSLSLTRLIKFPLFDIYL